MPGGISIHALRVEGDSLRFSNLFLDLNFYPRPPGGGRQHYIKNDVLVVKISIHALRVEGDALGHGRSLCAL